ncbi:MAG: DNA-formamidopyrimidine glycosylase [Calditrichaeota bacterium]|nr:DNA-formamidopyrimidine glycosylase [Calditrichota bacterium]
MPELPEVETIIRQLRVKVVGQVISHVEIFRASQWKLNDANEVPEKLVGKQIRQIRRQGKYIIFDFSDGGQLIIHLRMTGKLIWSERKFEKEKYTRTVFHFASGGLLQFQDTRALGTLLYLPPGDVQKFAPLTGLEPLDDCWTLDALRQRIQNSRLDAKSFLMDQKKIAGIGNIYASEILFRCQIHPERRVNELSDAEIKALFEQIPFVLNLAIEKMGTSLGDGKSNFRSVYNIEGEFQKMIQVYGREGEPCLVCGSPIIRIKQKGRSSYFCGKCQK